MEKWKCAVCGYIHQGEDPPQRCPVCGADRAKFSLVDGDAAKKEPVAETAAEKEPQTKQDTSLKWKCTVCGYVHTGPEPPDKCPVCGAPKSKFVLIEKESEEDLKKSEIDDKTDQYASALADDQPNKIPWKIRRHQIQDLMTTYHAHPIAVHVPNGALPLAVLFAFLSALFGSETLSAAAKWNTIFICLSMPVVILTGLSDWQRRFDMRVTNVFTIKMVCGGIVLSLTTILAVWWIVQPDILIDENASSGFFLFLNLLDLAAAAVAGWFGGKLVFPNQY